MNKIGGKLPEHLKEKMKKQCDIHVVRKRFLNKHEFSKYMTNNKPKQVWLDEFSKEEPYIIIDQYYEDKFIGVYNKQGVIISGKQDDFTWLFKKGMYINVC